MREARIIFPTTKGEPQRYLDWITDVFGGCTTFAGHGTWRNDRADGRVEYHNEPVLIVDIAMSSSTGQNHKLFDIARTFRKAMNETCVYIRDHDGFVHFVED